MNKVFNILIVLLLTVFLNPQHGFAYQPAFAKKVIHTVEKGQSLWSIAQFFDVDLSKVSSLNGLENPDLIFPGEKLIIEIQEDMSIKVYVFK